jgi:DNA-binding transcriptional MerR regulator
MLVPTGPFKRARGKTRLYSFGDLVVLKAIAALLKNGVSVLRMKAALEGLRPMHAHITKKGLPASLLFTDGQDVLFLEGRDVLRDLNTGQYAFAFVLDLAHIQQEVVKKSEKYPPRPISASKRRYGT